MVAETAVIQTETTQKSRRFSKSDITNVARLVSQFSLTESEACRRLNIKPDSYFTWKCSNGHSLRLTEQIEKFKASKIEQLVTKMEEVGSKDWRMYQARLGHIDPRFNQGTAQNGPEQAMPALAMFTQALAKLFSQEQPKAIVECPSEVKAIADTPQQVVSCGVQSETSPS